MKVSASDVRLSSPLRLPVFRSWRRVNGRRACVSVQVCVECFVGQGGGCFPAQEAAADV